MVRKGRRMRHAFLIIAHDNPEILYAQLEALDSENNDFYYHLDKRMNINKMDLERYAKKNRKFIMSIPKRFTGDTIPKLNASLDC